MNLFGQRRKPDDQLKNWLTALRKEIRSIDGELRNLERDRNKMKAQIRLAAKGNDINSAKIMAKAIARSNKTVENLYATKTQINSVALQLREQTGVLKVVGAMQSSSKIMEGMSRLVSIPKVAAISRNMAREMERAGLISEMIEDQFEIIDEINEEAADEEVDKVLAELVSDKLRTMESAPRAQVPKESQVGVDAQGLEELEKRMASLS